MHWAPSAPLRPLDRSRPQLFFSKVGTFAELFLFPRQRFGIRQSTQYSSGLSCRKINRPPHSSASSPQTPGHRFFRLVKQSTSACGADGFPARFSKFALSQLRTPSVPSMGAITVETASLLTHAVVPLCSSSTMQARPSVSLYSCKLLHPSVCSRQFRLPCRLPSQLLLNRPLLLQMSVRPRASSRSLLIRLRPEE